MLERQFWYSDKFTVGAGLTNYDQRIEIRQNAPFIMRAFSALVTAQALSFRSRRADGSWWTSNNFAHVTGFTNTAGFARPTPIYPQLVYPPSGSFVFDVRDEGGAGDTMYPMLVGVERYADGVLPPAAKPAAYTEQPDSFSVTATLTGADAKALALDVRSKTGDAFAIRTLTWRFLTTEPLTTHWRLRDEFGRAFMNNWVPMRLCFQGPTEATTLYPGLVFPEIVIPANGSLSLDLWNRDDGAITSTIELVFGGVRLVAV